MIKARLPNEYLPELMKESGEGTVRAIFESHFISRAAFDILLRLPFTPDDFEAFISERQRTFQDAIENLLIKERLDLAPHLRNLDADVEAIEISVRSNIEAVVGEDLSLIPPHIALKINERVSRALKKNASLKSERYERIGGKLQFFDLRELQDTIVAKSLWPRYETLFGSKEALVLKFDQLAELRNGIRHSREVSEVVRKEGEAAVLWFRQTLGKSRPQSATD